jgi:S1-C subfamily serine protease
VSRSKQGVVVAGTVDYNPQIETSLAVGDVICSVNQRAIASVSEFRSAFDHMKSGDPIVLQVERQGAYSFVSFEME